MNFSGRVTACMVSVALWATPIHATPVFTELNDSGPIQFGTPFKQPFIGSDLADMNGAGGPDAVSSAGSDVLVQLNHGGFSFADPAIVPMAVTGTIISFVIADLDGDGRPDVTATTTENQLIVRRNVGWPSFASAVTYPIAFTGNSICAADLDGDARPEIIVSHADSGRVSVYRNLGGGSFGTAVVYDGLGSSDYAWGSTPFHDVAAGHFDADADLDIAVLGHPQQRSVAVFLNSGDGGLGIPIISDAFGGLQAHVAVGDVDGDGLDDLAIGSEGFGFGILRATGMGSFVPFDSVHTSIHWSPRPALADLNSDGTPELVAFSRTGPGSYYGTSFVLVRSGFVAGQVPANQEYLTGLNPMGVAVADLDSDGDLDVLALTHSSQMADHSGNDDPTAWIYRNQGDGLLEGYRNFSRPPAGEGYYYSSRWIAGHATLDAPADLFRNADGHTQWSRNQGNGVFDAPVDLGHGALTRVTDLNNDERADLVLALDDGVGLRLSTADAKWGWPATYDGGSLLGFADFDADGQRDLAQLDGSRRVWIRPGSVTGSFGPPSLSGVTLPASSAVDLGDLDGDGRAEIVVCPSSVEEDTVHVLSLAGGGAMDTLARIVWPCPPPGYGSCVSPKPFLSPATPGHPGHLFLLAANMSGDPGALRSYRCRPDGEFLLASEMTTTREGRGMTLADFDLDGITDVALTLGADFDNGNVIAYRCDASGVLTPNWSAYPGAYPELAIAADFNGDSKPDLLVERTVVDRIAIFTNTTTTEDPTPTLLSLVSAHAIDGVVTLDWAGSTAAGEVASLERRTPSSAWMHRANLASDGTGHFRFDDTDIAPGTRYGYRLIRTVEQGAEVWVEIPDRATLQLIGVWPNPIGDAGFARFSLATSCEVRLEVLDVQGRRLAAAPPERRVAGTHEIRLPSAAELRPGIYLLRLSADGVAFTRAFAVMR